MVDFFNNYLSFILDFISKISISYIGLLIFGLICAGALFAFVFRMVGGRY